ncbi:MAG: phytanoyl-CoA dioxygenase family protein [Pseudomonadota bacterium]
MAVKNPSSKSTSERPLDVTQAKAQFQDQGYLVLRSAVPGEVCLRVKKEVETALNPLVGPAEFEADVGYPGAPSDRDDVGGTTPRRLLHAYARGGQLQRLAENSTVGATLRHLMDGADVMLSQCHHNCVMTKHPGFSSATMWHQDIRYWSFDEPELISAWFSLGPENRQNGALKVIPGSHRLRLPRGRLDKDLFLRPELAANRDLIHSAVHIEIDAGDVLLFHCRLLHAAGKNLTGGVKLSPVFTYHSEKNLPIPGTRSAGFPSIKLEC